ncbi:DNA methylase [Flavobacterium endophyticum]|uniref:DNA methylase n=1 Tax=Flavobacterium endophyticum TaxID=1540163 RepID=A0A495M8Z4_9FLAO|nr:DNA methyltransferase [Flavobacterium endophyticum]RKS21765.1 DNA methylase [Flavobacterium endophyticum]
MAEKQKRDRYEMHKYWGKKPSKDLKTLIETYTSIGDTILDPFSGYGVFCCEAFLLNRNVISNDLNPIANFINKQLLTKDVDIQKLEKEWDIIKEEFTPYIDSWYEFNTDGETLHLVNILRDKNNRVIKAKARSKTDKKTREISFSKEQSQLFLQHEKQQIINDWYPTNKLIENSRISAKKGMTVADLFTRRALACHAKLLSLIETCSTGGEKELLKLAFTANLANCSKLVPPIKSRSDMSQGAWMTGFYVGDTYLENNVLHYFQNRLHKIIKGKKDYLDFFKGENLQKYTNEYRVTQYDAKQLNIPDNSIDYIFTDPPYGDAVPYFEQSIIWNSWLKFNPDYEKEIVISDSKFRKKSIDNFELEIEKAFSEIKRVLRMEGYFSLTYHSLSGLEWKVITNACIKNGFEIIDFTWLVQKSFTPRQINRSKSIKGDVLITLQKVQEIRYTTPSDQEIKLLFINHLQEWLQETPLDTNEIFLRMMMIIFTQRIIIGNIDLVDILTQNFTFNTNNEWILNDNIELFAIR